MIQMIVGENLFASDEALANILSASDVTPEKYRGDDIDVNILADIFSGSTLFSQKRLVIIRDLSSNKSIWNSLPEWLNRLSDDTDIILIESKVDKRTKTYKTLQKISKIIDVKPMLPRDEQQAIKWLDDQAKSRKMTIPKDLLSKMVSRSIVENESNMAYIDQSRLIKSLQSLSVYDAPNEDAIDAVLPPTSNENIFELFVESIDGDANRAEQMLKSFQDTQSPHMVLGLISSQVFQLATLVYGDKTPEQVARDIGVHPFMISRLAPISARQTLSDVERYISLITVADERMKSSAGEPWDILSDLILNLSNKNTAR